MASQQRKKIILPLHGKRTRDGKVSEPDILYVMEKWLERHPEVKGRESDIQISRGAWTTHDGLRTEVVTVTIVDGPDIEAYDPADDIDLYEYYVAEARYYQG